MSFDPRHRFDKGEMVVVSRRRVRKSLAREKKGCGGRRGRPWILGARSARGGTEAPVATLRRAGPPRHLLARGDP